MQRNTLTSWERGNIEEALARMKRIASLHLSMRLRTSAVATITLLVSSWALVVTPPTKSAIQERLQQAWKALRKWPRDAPGLLRLVVMGHSTDLRYHVCRRALQLLASRLRRQGPGALARWHKNHEHRRHPGATPRLPYPPELAGSEAKRGQLLEGPGSGVQRCGPEGCGPKGEGGSIWELLNETLPRP